MKNLFAKEKPKIFCISYQRTGTTSVGQFFKDHGYRVKGYNRISDEWTKLYITGNYEAIFSSKAFKDHQVFEDDPWFCLDFYKFLFHRFPDSKFVLLTRDADKWFDSMVSHSEGKTLGNTFTHSKLYKREKEYATLFPGNPFEKMEIDNLLELNETHRLHYTDIYTDRNNEIVSFFDKFGKDRLVKSELENPNKWKTIGSFFNIKVSENYDSHANKSIK